MQVNVEKVGPCLAKVSVSVPGAEFEGEVRKALVNAGRGMRVKGFRPGKVPPDMVERQYGEQVREQTKEHFLRQAYQKAIDEHELRPIGYSRPGKDELALEKGQDFEHAFEVSLRPEFELGEYTGIEVVSELEPVLDQEVEAALEEVKRQQSNPEEAGEDGLPEDGMALCKLSWFHGSEEILVRDGLRLGPQSVPPGVDPESFTKAIVGSRADEQFELELVIPDDFEREELRGKTGLCKVEISQVYRMVQPTPEQLQELFSVDSPEALQAEVRKRIELNKRQREDLRIEEVCVAKLCEQHPMELPQPMVEQQTRARMEQLRNQLASRGMDGDKLDEHMQAQEEGIRKQSEKGLQSLFLIQAVAEKESLLVSEPELVEEMKTIAERNQATFEEVRDYYQQNQLVDQMALEVLERKVRVFLRESAITKDPS